MTHHASAVFANQLSEVTRLGQFAEEFGAACHLATDDTFAINLVLDELVINTISYGYDDDRRHDIEVSLELDGETLTIRVEDDGRPFNPLDEPPPDLDLPIDQRPIGGLGIHIVRSLATTIEYRREAGRNILTMTKTRS